MKPAKVSVSVKGKPVALLVSAWIETWLIAYRTHRAGVALLVSAWIETTYEYTEFETDVVALLVSAWIETR